MSIISLRAVLILLACSLSACARHDASQRYDHVEGLVQPHVSSLTPPDAAAHWTAIDLPQLILTTPALVPKQSDRKERDTHWYRMQAHVVQQNDLAIYIPRVRWPRMQGQLDVFVNGVRLDADSIVWNSPVILNVPDAIVARADKAEVLVALSLERGQSGGISRVWIGSADELRVRHGWRQFFQQRMPQVTGISFGILGAFAFIFWLYRRNESAYLLFAIAAALNVLRNLHYYFVNPESFGNGFWWLTINSLAWSMLAAHLFAFRLHGQQFPRAEKILMGSVAIVSIGSLLAVLAGVTIERWGPLTYLVQIVVGILVPTLSTIGAWRTRSPLALILAGVLWLNVVLGIHDFLLQNWRINPESAILLPYGTMAILAIFLTSIGRRYLGAIQGMERANVSLEQKLIERSRDLEESHRKLRVIEQEQAVVGERQRLMREMHDGLGSSLMSSLVMVEQGKLDTTQVAKMLRESIDDLTLTIDSLEPMGDDLLTLLGTLRYRLGKRLEAAGIKLEWQVQETPALPWLNPTTSLQILRILQETLTNTLKHARATTIRVETSVNATHVAIRLIDNGVGFDVASLQKSPTGRGLQNLERRAAAVDGRIEIVSRPGQTVVAVHLMRDRRLKDRSVRS
jgi:signal transduction histidine kinase